MSESQLYQGIVQKVITQGRHGPYAIAHVEKIGEVTFSLRPPVWEDGQDWPDPGTWVVLWQVRKKRAGWRAQRSRCVSPADEE